MADWQALRMLFERPLWQESADEDIMTSLDGHRIKQVRSLIDQETGDN